MKYFKTILIALLIVSCSKEEIQEDNQGCYTTVQAFEHDPTNTVLIFDGALEDFFLQDLIRNQQYALIITYCNGSTKKYTIVNK